MSLLWHMLTLHGHWDLRSLCRFLLVSSNTHLIIQYNPVTLFSVDWMYQNIPFKNRPQENECPYERIILRLYLYWQMKTYLITKQTLWLAGLPVISNIYTLQDLWLAIHIKWFIICNTHQMICDFQYIRQDISLKL